jgi:hypothetical protein
MVAISTLPGAFQCPRREPDDYCGRGSRRVRTPPRAGRAAASGSVYRHGVGGSSRCREAVRSAGWLRAGDRIEFSIGLGGAAFDVMLATDPRGSAGEPQIDDRHLLDGVAGAVAWSAAAD